MKDLENLGLNFTLKTFIKGRNSNAFYQKLMDYLKFYIEIFRGLFLKNSQFNKIYVHFPLHVAFLLIFVNKPIFLNFHGSEISRSNLFSKLLFFFLMKLVEKRNVQIVVPSHFYKDKVNAIFHLDTKKYIVYPSGGINTSIFKPFTIDKIKELKKTYNCQSNSFIIGFTSSLIEDKGVRVFLKTLKKLENIKKIQKLDIFIVGDGPLKREVEEFVRSYNNSMLFHLLPAQNQKKLSELFNIFDLLVFPSSRESLGLIGIEAMACKKVVIAADNGGVKSYLINNQNGFLFEKNNDTQLKDKILNYINLDKKKLKLIEDQAINTALLYESKKVNLKLIERL
ncbi:glycosyltransferase family 4 protein [Marivirga arenosa]|uniref:Glycosyltransferase family 4 protein n=1 Tax=Marivirga arenosa TaxID=3059076 RepID=A0AA49JB28_9BACT|nr:glycosyltransferase family 4 protein [Marivirga sp. ABR2-2]WKK86019.1 glycosyltransferase family 4 protein [Marivirga sp. ABR2-2]